MGLIVNDVPWDVAVNMDDLERKAWLIILGEAAGKKWDWSLMRWEPDKD